MHAAPQPNMFVLSVESIPVQNTSTPALEYVPLALKESAKQILRMRNESRHCIAAFLPLVFIPYDVVSYSVIIIS